MNKLEVLAFVEHHGIVLESARSLVPNLAEAIAGEPIQGSYWSHPLGQEIFALTRAVRASKDILVCRLVDGKVTYIHRRLWPSIVCLSDELDQQRLGALREVHTSSGRHIVETMPFPEWVSAEVRARADRLSRRQAADNLGLWFTKQSGSGGDPSRDR